MATIDDLNKIEIKIGKVIFAEKVENTDKLIRLEVDFGDEKRQIVSGIAEFYEPENLAGKEFPFITNLDYRRFKGIESQGMILAAKTADGKPALLRPEEDVPPGSQVI